MFVNKLFKDENGYRLVFEGEMKKGKLEKGVFFYDSGHVYAGEWVDGDRSKGKIMYPNGGQFEGEYKDDKKHGWGTLTHPDGQQESGQWSEGDFLGQKIAEFDF